MATTALPFSSAPGGGLNFTPAPAGPAASALPPLANGPKFSGLNTFPAPANGLPGISATVPGASGVSTTPTLTAQFTPPPTGTITAPAVHTSGAAEDNINNVTTTANTAQADTAAATAAKAQAAQTMPGTPGSSTNGGPNAQANTETGTTDTGASDLSTQIDSILSGLDTAYGNSATATPEQQGEIDAANSAIGFDNTTLSQVGDAINSMAAGTFPLTPGEQAQVNGIASSYTNALKSAVDYANNLVGGTTARQASTGLQEYSPAYALSNIHAAVMQGYDKVSAVNDRITSAMTKLTTALQNADYKNANTLYNNISKDITTRQNEIDKINTSITTATKQMHTDALNEAKLQISTLTKSAATNSADYFKAQNLILSQTRLSDTERAQMIKELNSANTGRTAAERAANATAAFAQAFVPGATTGDGTPTVDANGYITPAAFKAAIADAPAEGLTRSDFIKAFGSMVYSDPKAGIDARAYGLTPAEVKLITGAVPAAGTAAAGG